MCALSCPLFAKSLLAFFPEEIYRHVGSPVVLQQFLDAVDLEKLVAVQFLRGVLVCLTFKNSESCDEVIQRGFFW